MITAHCHVPPQLAKHRLPPNLPTDKDIATLDTTKNIAYIYIFEKYRTLVQIMCEDKGKENDYVLFKN